MTSKRFKIERIKDGPDKGQTAIFSGDLLVGLIDQTSLEKYLSDADPSGNATPADDNPPIYRIRRDSDGNVERMEPMSERSTTMNDTNEPNLQLRYLGDGRLAVYDSDNKLLGFAEPPKKLD